MDEQGDERPGPRRATDGLEWRAPADAPVVSSSPQAPEPPQALRSRRTSWGVAAVAAGAALLGGLVGGGLVALVAESDSGGSSGASPGPRQAVTSVTVQQTSAVAEAAARGRASVVKITSTRRTQSGTEQDVGSGVVIDGQGHIVTNAHVVLGTETLKVFLPDGTEQAAILVGHDSPFTDLAVLQVGPGKAVPLEIGDSAALAPGETVVAVGNPLAEFEGSVSAGVVSGLNRKRTMEGVRQDDLIQTDAALNNGNSGGALLNLKGQFVGMPTFVVRQARSSVPVEGIGFAIPASRVMEIARGIIAAGGPLPRPSLGMDHLDLTPDVSDRLSRVAVDHGALVRAVTQGGPGAAAGIQAGDVITRLAGEEISQDVPLFNVLMRLNAGQTVPVVLNRAGRIIEVEVRLGKRAQ